jgi:putative ABC transport system permease protein
MVPVPARVGLYPGALAVAGAAGLLAALLFTLVPLGRARRIPAATLFRAVDAPETLGRGLLGDRPVLIALGLTLAALAGLVIASSGNPPLAAGFVGGALAIVGLFRLLALALARVAGRVARRPWVGPGGRLALSGLHHPGSDLVGMVLSLGLGMTVLVAIALVEGNLADQIGGRMPARAPSAYLIDIQPDQRVPLEEVVASTDPQATIETAPMVRARISTVKGVPLAEARISPEVQWAARGDRGLSVAASLPPGSRLVAGKWWPAEYRGRPLVSIDRRVAQGFGLGLGDLIGFNILGHEVEAEIVSLRDIDWASLSMNFAFLLSPGALDGAPLTLIATLGGAKGGESRLEKAITDRLPNVSVIRVGEALETVRAIIAQADRAVRLAGAIVLAAGVIVLAGAVAAGHRRRVHQAVVLKVLGATGGQIRRAWIIEMLVVGLVTGAAAVLFGSAAAWAILVQVMRAEWVFLPSVTLLTLGLCVAASLAAGLIAGWRALARPAAATLRAD